MFARITDIPACSVLLIFSEGSKKSRVVGKKKKRFCLIRCKTDALRRNKLLESGNLGKGLGSKGRRQICAFALKYRHGIFREITALENTPALK